MKSSVKSFATEAMDVPDASINVEDLHFYRANEKPYGAFSNLFKRDFIFEGVKYPTAEHAYQAGKASKKNVRDWILKAPTPSLVAMAAHGLYVWDIVPNWAEIKFDRMRAILREKFTQNPDLLELLLSTGNRRLVEAGTTNNPVNRLWGEVNGKGQNTLGIMLMELREQLSTQPKTQKPLARKSPSKDLASVGPVARKLRRPA